MIRFERVSFDTFKKDINSEEIYNKIIMPKRGTEKSAGYDFYLNEDVEIKPNEEVKIPTGIKAKFDSDIVLLLVIRSSIGFKYNIRLVNQLGVIDSDYYNNEDNEGHIYIKIKNEGTMTRKFLRGEKIVQGIFVHYLKTDDDETKEIRKGGISSTDK